MTRRGGRGKQGGQRRKDGRYTDPITSLISYQPDPISPISEPSPTNVTINTEESGEPEQEEQPRLPDTVYDTGEENGNGMISKKRGVMCGKGARKIMKACMKRLPVEFNFQMRKVISANESAFMHECGYILRNNCSLQFKEWRRVPNEVRLSLRHKLTTLFDIDVENLDVCKVIDSYMESDRAKLHDYFKEIEGSKDITKAKDTPPSNISKEDWEYLCNMWKLHKRRLWHVESEKWIVEMVRRVQYTITLSVERIWILHRVNLRLGGLHIGMQKRVGYLPMQLQFMKR